MIKYCKKQLARNICVAVCVSHLVSEKRNPDVLNINRTIPKKSPIHMAMSNFSSMRKKNSISDAPNTIKEIQTNVKTKWLASRVLKPSRSIIRDIR